MLTVESPPLEAVEFENPGQISLKGSLILADPSLRGSGFSRSVLLLTNHKHDDGAGRGVNSRIMMG